MNRDDRIQTENAWMGGWWRAARALPSPHCDARPCDDISLLVLHNISLPPGQFSGDAVEQFFLGQLDCSQHPYFERLRDVRVSAHFFIRRHGEVVQFVDVTQRAWHAGVSSFQGRERCNDYSLGIELEGCDELAYTPEQYGSLLALSQALLQRFPALTLERITGHQHIAPSRKTDPGPAFDWDAYRAGLARAWPRPRQG